LLIIFAGLVFAGFDNPNTPQPIPAPGTPDQDYYWGAKPLSDIIDDIIPAPTAINPEYDIYGYITIKSISYPSNTTLHCIGTNSCKNVGDMVFTDALGIPYKFNVISGAGNSLVSGESYGVKFTVRHPIALKGLSIGLNDNHTKYILFNILPPPYESKITSSIEKQDYLGAMANNIYSDDYYDSIVTGGGLQ
jgi:hypothetical protein